MAQNGDDCARLRRMLELVVLGAANTTPTPLFSAGNDLAGVGLDAAVIAVPGRLCGRVKRCLRSIKPGLTVF
jgi:hypothetical protein